MSIAFIAIGTMWSLACLGNGQWKENETYNISLVISLSVLAILNFVITANQNITYILRAIWVCCLALG